jgi:hypothetical protein
LLSLLVVGCGEDATAPEETPVVRLEVLNDPQVDFDPAVGTTTVVLQFVARNGNGTPLEGEEIQVDLRLNGNPVDSEGLLQEDSEQLRSNVYLSLVLDASFSMQEQQPPAFGPMLAAARKTVAAGRALYNDRPGTFDWTLYWFNDRIFTPLESVAGTEWLETDIERIPAPGPGTFTKLYAATEVAVARSKAFAEGSASDPRDHHVIVVLSDGADNYSWFPNSEINGNGSVGANRSYSYFGYRATSKEDVIRTIESHPSLKLNVIGLGSAVVDADLQQIATAGHGRYFKNPKASEVEAVFDRVALELTSIQTRGVTLPLPSGDYRLDVVVHHRGAHATHTVLFHGGDAGAGPR